MQDCNAPIYEKMEQIQWLANEVQENFQKYFDLGKFLKSNDEMMIGYMVKYCMAQ